MPDLLFELLEVIVSYISDKQTLCALCLTNKTLGYISEKNLYSTMTNRMDRRMQTQFLATIIQSPHLVEHVQEYHTFSLSSPRNSAYDLNLWENTTKGLRAMKNLKAVVSREWLHRPIHAGLLDMDGGVTFQLEKLVWSTESDSRGLQTILEPTMA